MNKLKVPMDAAGRVVIPKPVRDLLHLEAGTTLCIDVQNDTIMLRAETEGMGCLTRRNGILVIGGELRGSMPEITEVRRDRLRHVVEAPATLR